MPCMFQHEDKENSDDEDNNDDNDFEDETEDGNITINDIEPSMKKVEEAMRKVDELLKKQSLKCDVCSFEAKNSNGLTMHKKSKHTNNSN